ncbi:TRAP-type C4-dicarboxylate transport system substrate-binding protein [Eilatimonas milleporae]|uniref:TRAP-type C4-dicarboxylate transport system substrate-binding protein n=2 Tax=Eilatimonas milleporae TaxID=911205 RepID=A0A3M0CUQ4_9PROT|nr:TRAP-type C4-dicarboxylate transport system substrate-binding protein [Eilatimonas milleporae]
MFFSRSAPALLIMLWLCRAGTALGAEAAGTAVDGAGPTPDTPVKVTVGAFAAPGSPWDKQWKHFKQQAEGRSGGALAVKLLTKGEAGGEATTMTYIRRNRMQFGGFTLAGVASVVPELDILLTPFFFADRQELDFVMDEYLLDTFQDLFAEKNLVLAYWVEVGWLHMYGKSPVLQPADMTGRRMRVQASRAAQVLAGSLGAEMLQMEFADLIPSLQTGLVFGGETNAVLYSLTGLANEAPHMTLTRHTYDTGVIVGNKTWLDGLPSDLRDILLTAFPPSDQARAQVRAMAKALLAKLAGQGITLHELSDEERAVWQRVTSNNYRTLIDQIGGRAQDIYDRMVEGRAHWRHMQAAAATGAIPATARTGTEGR